MTTQKKLIHMSFGEKPRQKLRRKTFEEPKVAEIF